MLGATSLSQAFRCNLALERPRGHKRSPKMRVPSLREVELFTRFTVIR